MVLRRFFHCVTVVLVIGFIAVTAFGQIDGDLSKVDPLLKLEAYKLVGKPLPKDDKAPLTLKDDIKLVQPLSAKGIKVPPPPSLTFPSLISTETRKGMTYLEAFIKLTPGASTDNLVKLGVEVGSRSEDIITADIPPDVLDKVNALSEVVNIEGSKYATPMNDAATLETGVNTVWTNTSNRGQNALVGVTDSGIDWTHDDFKTAGGQSRILYIWDQSDDVGPNPSGYNYGSVWTQAQINAGTPREQDNSEGSGGHGTHVTGTAAGDGSATGNGQPANRFVGVANQSDIVFAKTKYTDQSIADACNWMYTIAGAVGKPIALNMSLGSIGGPHDGSTALEQYLNGLLGGPGRSLCISAGNSGGQTIHAFSTLAQETGSGDTSLNETPVLAFWAYPAPVQQVQFGVSVVEIWWPAGSNIQFRPVWRGASGLVVGSTWFGGSTNEGVSTIADGDLANVKITTGAQIPYNDGRNILKYGYVVVESPQGAAALNGYPFYIQLKGAGVQVHAWHIIRDQGAFIPRQVFINSQVTPPTLLIEPDDFYTAGTAGTADEPICVGSYVTKVQWTDSTGATQTQQGATIGAISDFSSRGPRRDGNTTLVQQKPDICGPGEAIISSLSSVLTQRPASDIERDGKHQKMQGTSMSSPMVTGICALMLSKNPSLTADQIKQILRSTARDAGDPGWDPVFGAGKVDAVAALNAVPGGTVTRGDVNADGNIDARDAIQVSRHIGGQQTLAGDALTAADADENGTVNQADVDWILEKKVGLR